MDLLSAWGRATVAELSWIAEAGPVGLPVVPLVLDGRACVALPYAQFDQARSMAGGPVAWTVTDQMSGGRVTAAAVGRVEVVEDPVGKRFIDHLLEQEVVKYPPTRLRSDSLMSRRENWWWTPRIIVTLAADGTGTEVVGRTRASDALLVRGGPGGPVVQVVTAPEWPGEPGTRVDVFGRDGSAVRGRGEPALVYGHAHSPDFERWERWHRSGRIEGERLVVEDAAGFPADALPPMRLLERYLAHRAVARACRAGLAAAGR